MSVNQYTPYLYKRVSLVSTNNMRFEGQLFMINQQDNTITLNHVKCFGTEDRDANNPIPGSNEIYEFIVTNPSLILRLDLCQDQFMNPQMGMFNMPFPNYMNGPQYFPYPMWGPYNYQMWGGYGGQMPYGNTFLPNDDLKRFDFQTGFEPLNNMMGDLNIKENEVKKEPILSKSGEVGTPKEQSKLEFKLPDFVFDNKTSESNEKTFKTESRDESKKPVESKVEPTRQNEEKFNNQDPNFNKNDNQKLKKDNTAIPGNQTESISNKNDTKNDIKGHSKNEQRLNEQKRNEQRQNDPRHNEQRKNEQRQNEQRQNEQRHNEQRQNEQRQNDQKQNEKRQNEQRQNDQRQNEQRHTDNNFKNRNESYQGNRNESNNQNRYHKNENSNEQQNNDNSFRQRNNYQPNNGNTRNPRYNNNRYPNNYRRNENNRNNNFQASDFDVFESTRKFEKEKEMAEIEAEFQKHMIQEGGGTEEFDGNPENAYNPSSLYDNLSCETLDKMNNKKNNKFERAKMLKEQEQLDAETFGFTANRNNFRNNNYNANRNNNRPYNNNNRNNNYRNNNNGNYRNQDNYNNGNYNNGNYNNGNYNNGGYRNNQDNYYNGKNHHQKKVFRVKNNNNSGTNES